MNNATQRKRRRSGAEIQAIVERYYQSGLNRTQFVQGEGICLMTLSRYLKKARPGTLPSSQTPVHFIEMERAAQIPVFEAGSGNRRDPYRISFAHGVSLEIPAGFCVKEAASLLELLSLERAK